MEEAENPIKSRQRNHILYHYELHKNAIQQEHMWFGETTI